MLIKKNIKEIKTTLEYKSFIINFFKDKVLEFKNSEKNTLLNELIDNKFRIKEEIKQIEILKNNIVANSEEEIAEISLLDEKIFSCNTLISEIDLKYNDILTDYKDFKLKINQASTYNLQFLIENFHIVKDWNYEFSEFIKKIKMSEKKLVKDISSNSYLLNFFFNFLSNNPNFSKLNQLHFLYGWQLLFRNTRFRKRFYWKKIFKKRFIFYKLKKFIKRKLKLVRVLTFIKFNQTRYYKNFFSNNSLVKKIPLTRKVLLKNNLKLFYKMFKEKKKNNSIKIYDFYSNKFFKKKFKIYFRDFNQKPYWKFRQARMVHWNLFFKKTLRQQRYLPFLNKYMKKYTNFCYNLTFFFNFFFKTYFSWTRLSKLESFLKVSLVKKSHVFLKLPVFFFKFFKWKSLKKKNYFLRKKIGKWSFLNYKKSQKPWLQRKKNNNPKFINHKEPDFFFLKSISYWDFFTGTIYMKKTIDNFSLPSINNFKVNWQLKLHVFRYNASKIWLYL